MINKPALLRIIGDIEKGSLPLPGEVAILREAVELLDDLASCLDKIMPGRDHEMGFDHETTQELRVIEQGRVRSWGDRLNDDRHWG